MNPQDIEGMKQFNEQTYKEIEESLQALFLVMGSAKNSIVDRNTKSASDNFRGISSAISDIRLNLMRITTNEAYIKQADQLKEVKE